MQKNDKKRTGAIKKTPLLIGGIILLLDQLTKYIVRVQHIQTQTGIIDITYTTNTGSLFSLFSSFEYSNIIFIILSIIIGITISILFIKEHDQKMKLPLAIIIAGIMGNLIDRIYFGAVIDWINFNVWPIFNIADSALVIGIIWIGVLQIQQTRNKK